MEPLELVVVQFDECRRLMEKGRTAYLRLALILIDNAVEVIMVHRISNALFRNHMYEKVIEVLGDDPTQWPDDSKYVDEAREKFVSKGRRREIDRFFGAKVEFLVERGLMPAVLGAGLNKLHDYRNEAHHQDKLRTETLAPAVRIYFDMACTLLADYFNPGPIMWTLWAPAVFAEKHPVLTHYGAGAPEPWGTVAEMPRRVSERLLTEVALDVDSLRCDLMDHLRTRITQMETHLRSAQVSLRMFDGWKPADMLRMAQHVADVEKGQAALSLEQMRGKKYPYKLSDIDRWRREIDHLEELTDRYSLFAEFARIEDELEPCFEMVRELADQVEGMVQEAYDLWRGK